MEIKPVMHPAFGYFVARTVFPAGGTYTIDPVIDNIFTVGTNWGYVWLYAAGRTTNKNDLSGEVFERVAGDCTLSKPFPLGQITFTVDEDLEIFCISPFVNASRLPLSDYVREFSLPAGQQTILPEGTQLFLGKGALHLADKRFEGPTQIKVVTGEKTVTAEGDVYGFLVS